MLFTIYFICINWYFVFHEESWIIVDTLKTSDKILPEFFFLSFRKTPFCFYFYFNFREILILGLFFFILEFLEMLAFWAFKFLILFLFFFFIWRFYFVFFDFLFYFCFLFFCFYFGAIVLGPNFVYFRIFFILHFRDFFLGGLRLD